jgi:hypothetical protein
MLNNYNPMGFFIRGIHAALTDDGAGVVRPLLVLAAWAIVALIIATLTFRWESGDSALSMPRHTVPQTA